MPLWATTITAAATLRVAAALVLFLSGAHARAEPPPLPWLVYVLLAACFGATGLALVAVNKHDARATWLGGALVLVAAPLTSPFFNDRPLADWGWLWFVRVDVFLPALLWRFAAEFPSPLVDRPARLFHRVAAVALAAGVLLAAVNLSYLAVPSTDVAAWRLLFRPPAGASVSLYYPIVFGLTAAAFVALVWRATKGRADEQRRLTLFAVGLSAGAAPLVIHVLLETIPAYYTFIHRPGIEQPVGALLFGALAVIPFLTAYSVLFDHVVDVRVVLRAAMQYALARYTILALAVLPFAALLLMLYRERAQPLEAFVSGTRPLVLGGTVALGLLALRTRTRLIAMLDRRYFREGYDTRELLDQVMGDALRADSAADLEAKMSAAIHRALHAELALFVSRPDLRAFARPDGAQPLPDQGVLAALVAGDSLAMDVDPSDRRSPFRRLPVPEQQWLLTAGFVLVVPLQTADRRPVGLFALTAKQSGLPYSMEDRRFLSAVAASASLALDNLRLRSTPSDASERPARECQSCSRLNGPDANSCSCGGPVVACAAPHTLRGVYRLDRRIGAGGMGVVYLARDVNLDRPVAIKTLPAVSPEQSARLRTEARAMAAVQHHHLAVIHGIETWQGIPFLIQEYLAGGTLADRLRTGPMPVAEAITLCMTIAEALHQLHHASIVHRDVKPSNIGFTDRGVAKLLDFGLAKLPTLAEPETGSAETHLAGPAERFGDTAVAGGTPAYMPPEALELAAPARPGLDLWALAVVLFECVAGRRPFAGRTRDEIRDAARLGLREGPRAFNHACPPALDAWLLTALHAQPSRRPASALDLHRDLATLRSAQP